MVFNFNNVEYDLYTINSMMYNWIVRSLTSEWFICKIGREVMRHPSKVVYADASSASCSNLTRNSHRLWGSIWVVFLVQPHDVNAGRYWLVWLNVGYVNESKELWSPWKKVMVLDNWVKPRPFIHSRIWMSRPSHRILIGGINPLWNDGWVVKATVY